MAVTKRKLIYPMVVLLVFLCALVIAVFYIQLKDLDALRDMVAKQIQAETQREVTIGSASLDLSEGVGLRLRLVTLKGSSEQESDFTCDQVLVVLHTMPLLNGEVKIQKLIFEGLKVQVTRNDQGDFNFGDMTTVGKDQSGASFADLIRTGLMHNVQVRKSELWLVDHAITPGSKPLVSKIQKLSLSITKPPANMVLRVHLKGETPLGGEAKGIVKLDGKMRIPPDWSDLSKVAVEGNILFQDFRTPPFNLYLAKVFEQNLGEHAVTLETKFAGTLDGRVHLTGALNHAQRSAGIESAQSTASRASRGTLGYDLVFNRDTLVLRKLDYQAGDFSVQIRGSYADFLSEKAWLSISLSAAPFQIQDSEAYLPLKVFNREAHQRLHALLKKGEIEFASLAIQGPPTLFEGRPNSEIEKYDSASIILRQGDFGAAEFPFENVTGEFHFKDGVARVNIQEAHYDHVRVSNISGTITHPLTAPSVKATMEVEGAWAPLFHMVEKRGAFPEDLGFVKEVSQIQGAGHAKISVQGPLEQIDRLSVSGEVSLDRAGFALKGWSGPAHNISGKVHFKNKVPSPAAKGKKTKPVLWDVHLKNLNGEWGGHTFREVNGESLLLNGLPMKKIQGKIRLGEMKATEIIKTPFEGTLQTVMDPLLLQSGDIDFNFKHIGAGPGSKRSQSQGTLKIKNLFAKSLKGYRPLKNLNAEVSFDDRNIEFKTQGGWYGDSPLDIKGQFKGYSEAKPDLKIEAHSAEFLNQDFAGLPFLDTLEYKGPAKVTVEIHSTDLWLKVRQQVDLTRASYRFRDILIKPENVANTLEVSARMKTGGRVDVDKLIFELEGSRVEGKGFLKSVDDPQFSIQLGSDQFKVWPAAQYVRPLQGALGGSARFQVSAEGNFQHLEEADIQGKVRLQEVEFRPESLKVPVRIKMDLKFKNSHFEISKGKLEMKKAFIYFGGTCEGGEAPHVKMDVVASGLDLNEIVKEDESSESILTWLAGTHVFSSGSGEFDIKINSLNYEFWTFPEMAGKLTFKDQILETENLIVGHPVVDEMKVSGKLFLADSPTHGFDAQLVSRRTKIEKLLDVFGGAFDFGLTGDAIWVKAHLKGRGSDWTQVTQSLTGRVSFDIHGGRIHTGRLLNGVSELFEVPTDAKTIAERNKPGSNSYMFVLGDFKLVNGVAHTENFSYEDKGERLSLVGDFNLDTEEIDVVVGFAPFRRVGRILEDVPLFKYIFTGGDSLFTSYHTVKGTFSDPKDEAILMKTIGDKVLGTLKDVVTAPADIFKDEPDAHDH